MRRGLLYSILCLTLCGAFQHAAAAADSVYTEELTWNEIHDRMQAGATTAIVPTGGTEQNGPHMVIGKHNIIIHYTSGAIAKQLGNALVVPVIAYVPEGRIDPPEGHMMFPGTISVRNETFAALLEDTAASLKAEGFKLICFVGEHGGNQDVQQQVADKLNAQWKDSGVRVLHVADYYANNGQDAWVKQAGIKVEDPGAHAGFEDTSEVMAIDPSGVRVALRGAHTETDYKQFGAMGDSTQSSAEYGRHLLDLKVAAAVKQINAANHL